MSFSRYTFNATALLCSVSRSASGHNPQPRGLGWACLDNGHVHRRPLRDQNPSVRLPVPPVHEVVRTATQSPRRQVEPERCRRCEPKGDALLKHWRNTGADRCTRSLQQGTLRKSRP